LMDGEMEDGRTDGEWMRMDEEWMRMDEEWIRMDGHKREEHEQTEEGAPQTKG